MFKHFFATLTLAAALSLTTVSAGEMILLEEAAEFDRLSARVSADGHGSIKVKVCDDCEELRLKIAPGTQLVVNGKSRPLRDLNYGALSAGTVFFDAENLKVLRISGSR